MSQEAKGALLLFAAPVLFAARYLFPILGIYAVLATGYKDSFRVAFILYVVLIAMLGISGLSMIILALKAKNSD